MGVKGTIEALVNRPIAVVAAAFEGPVFVFVAARVDGLFGVDDLAVGEDLYQLVRRISNSDWAWRASILGGASPIHKLFIICVHSLDTTIELFMMAA